MYGLRFEERVWPMETRLIQESGRHRFHMPSIGTWNIVFPFV